MLLLVDAGNTRVKWAIPMPGGMLGSAWLHQGAVARAQLEELADSWRVLPITRVLVSNVAGVALRTALPDLLPHVATSAIDWFTSQSALAGIRNAYKNPEQLGSDRFATAIAAHALFPAEALLIVTCGTATTIDAVSPDGLFAGGMILPGLGLMATSLALNTAQLPQISDMKTISPIFADNTIDGIISGCIAAHIGAIERAVAMHKRQYGDVHCLLAGGASTMLVPYLEIPYTQVEDLALKGLHIVAR